MLMYDVAETDENGEKLIFHPRKAHEMQTCVSGQAVPILTKGVVLLNMADGDRNGVTVNAGTEAYAGDDGAVIAHSSAPSTLLRIGTFLGPRDTNGEVLVKLDFNGANDHG